MPERPASTFNFEVKGRVVGYTPALINVVQFKKMAEWPGADLPLQTKLTSRAVEASHVVITNRMIFNPKSTDMSWFIITAIAVRRAVVVPVALKTEGMAGLCGLLLILTFYLLMH